MGSVRFGIDAFAGQAIGDIDRAAIRKCNAIAAMADVIDDELLSHGARR